MSEVDAVKLATTLTEEYFVGRSDDEIFRDITSPDDLFFALLYLQPERERMLVIFHDVAKHRRIDLLEVFFKGFLTVETLQDDALTDIDHVHYTDLFNEIIEEGAVDVMTFFLDKGLDPNTTIDLIDTSLLSSACISEKIDIISLLLQRGADPNQEDIFGETPTSYAMLSDNVRILDLLIVHGANLYHCDENGESLWMFPSYPAEPEVGFRRLASMRIFPNEVDIATMRNFAENDFMKERIRVVTEILKEYGVILS